MKLAWLLWEHCPRKLQESQELTSGCQRDTVAALGPDMATLMLMLGIEEWLEWA
ncbi:hypothetical protein BIFGAL_03696 [Bifidobacterium gallicum DSM 20093 = LMG 11596]|uniref:Uncharacterized protein n=1 Tax=Bifidobacterium gallicum DSM 20093 = LMG 11596 TaxID=561180 RepID=D1NV18_9BIFI|nr:hypothetical protein BIFGAL_03696 [Bifidobacterium gallicum DSM 20093 = LMG 11596]